LINKSLINHAWPALTTKQTNVQNLYSAALARKLSPHMAAFNRAKIGNATPTDLGRILSLDVPSDHFDS
jgi:hypothetical protein